MEQAAVRTRFGGMDARLRRWQGENQPTLACVHVGKIKDVAEKGAVGFWLLAVEENMRTDDHGMEFYLTVKPSCPLAPFDGLPDNVHQCPNAIDSDTYFVTLAQGEGIWGDDARSGEQETSLGKGILEIKILD